jgi:lambda family phage minor tail protein L
MANELQKNRDLRRSIGRDIVDIEPSAIVELYELYFDVDFLPFRFHSGTNGITKDIVWRGNYYLASAIEVEGFEANTMGRLPRPKLAVSNHDFIISNILREFSDFRNGKFIRYRLFLKNLDNVNFDDNQNPFGNPDPNAYLSEEKYHISQKIVENKHLVQFELITPFDLESVQVASRAIYGRYCYWQYRGIGCNYQGDLICKEDDQDFTFLPKKHIKDAGGRFVGGGFDKMLTFYKWQEGAEYKIGDIVFVENKDLNGFKDPIRTWYVCIDGDEEKTENSTNVIYHISNRANRPSQKSKFWEKDGCAKTISACQKRFDADFYKITKDTETYIAYNDSDAVNKVLPFGGFPGTDRFRYE